MRTEKQVGVSAAHLSYVASHPLGPLNKPISHAVAVFIGTHSMWLLGLLTFHESCCPVATALQPAAGRL